MIKHLFLKGLFIMTCIFSGIMIAQSPITMYYNDGTQLELHNKGISTSDGGAMMTGYTDLGTGIYDGVMLKVSNTGTVQWQQRIGTSAYNDEIMGVCQTQDGGYVVTGYLHTAATTINTFIYKFGAGGVYKWQKQYNTPSNSGAWGKSIIQTADKGYVICGYGGADAHVTKTDSLGVLQWSKKIASNFDVTDIIETSDGNLVAMYQTGIIVKIDVTNGSTLWYKSAVTPIGYSSQLKRIKETPAGDLIISGTVFYNGFNPFHRPILYKFSSTGTLKWSKMYTYTSSYNNDDLGCDVTIASDNNYVISTELNLMSGTYYMGAMKVDTSGAIIWSKVSGAHGTLYNQPCAHIGKNADGTFWIMGASETSGPSNSWMNFGLHKISSGGSFGGCYESTATMTVSQLALTNGTLNLTTANALVAISNTNAPNSYNFTSGVTCGPSVYATANFTSNVTSINVGQFVNFTDLSTGSPAINTWTWTFSGGSPGTSTVQNPTGIQYNTPGCYLVSLAISNGSASDTKTVSCYINVTPAPGSPFTNYYNDGTQLELFHRGISTSDGGAMMVGYSDITTGIYDGVMLKISSTGTVQWQQRIGTAAYHDEIFGVCQTQDGGYVVTGYVHTAATTVNTYIYKFGAGGVLKWQREYNTSTNSGAWGHAIIEAPDKSLIFSGYGGADGFITKTDSMGVIQWSKKISNNFDFVDVILASDGNIIGIGNAGNIAKVDISNGAVIWTRTTTPPAGYNTRTFRVRETPTGDILLSGYVNFTGFGSYYRPIIYKFSSTGTLKWAKMYQYTSSYNNNDYGHDIQIAADGNYVASYQLELLSGTTYMGAMKVDTSGTVIWSKVSGQHGTLYSMPVADLGKNADGSFWLMGVSETTGPANSWMNFGVHKMTGSGGFGGCYESTTFMLKTTFTLTSGVLTTNTNNALVEISNSITPSSYNFLTGVSCAAAPGPVAGFAASSTVACQSGCFNFTDQSTNTPTSWTWAFPGASPSSSSSQNPTNICYNSPGTYVVSLYVTNANGSSTYSTTIQINSAPTITLNASSSYICAGGNTTLTATGANTYTWMPGNLTGSVQTVTPSSTTVYTVTGSNGCTGTKMGTITVNPLPSLSISATSSNVCSGGTVALTASGASTYTWSNSVTNGSAFTPTATETYTVIGTSTAGCNNSAVITVTLSTIPASPSAISGPTITCNANPSIYSVSPVTGATGYSWNLPATWSGNSTSNSINTTPGAGSGTIEVYAMNLCGISSAQQMTVAIGTSPTVSISTTASTICSGQSSTLTASGANTYTWNSGPANANYVVNPTTSTVYSVTGTNTIGCIDTETITIGVFGLPTVQVSSNNNTICVGQSATLTASGANTYTWNTSGTGPNITVSPTVNTTYTVTGTAANTCSSSTTITQYVDQCTGILNISSVNTLIGIYPNPTKGEFYIQLQQISQDVIIEVYNDLGQLIVRVKPATEVQLIDLGKYANGIYQVRILEGSKLIKQDKIIKE